MHSQGPLNPLQMRVLAPGNESHARCGPRSRNSVRVLAPGKEPRARSCPGRETLCAWWPRARRRFATSQASTVPSQFGHRQPCSLASWAQTTVLPRNMATSNRAPSQHGHKQPRSVATWALVAATPRLLGPSNHFFASPGASTATAISRRGINDQRWAGAQTHGWSLPPRDRATPGTWAHKTPQPFRAVVRLR